MGLEKPYKRIVKGKNLYENIGENEDTIRNVMYREGSISLIGFQSMRDAEELAERFPKYVNVKPFLSHHIEEVYGAEFKVAFPKSPHLGRNEKGEKRLDGFIRYMKEWGYIY